MCLENGFTDDDGALLTEALDVLLDLFLNHNIKFITFKFQDQALVRLNFSNNSFSEKAGIAIGKWIGLYLDYNLKIRL